MFCEHCGSKMTDGANFCTKCGAKVKLHDAVPPPVAQTPPAPRPAPVAQAIAAQVVAATQCTWCGSPLGAGILSCPGCGGKVSAMGVSTHSGWLQLPGRKDMAKLQF